MEGDYKRHVRSGNVFGLAGEILAGSGGGGKAKVENPLMRGSEGEEEKKDGFEAMNRDSGQSSQQLLATVFLPDHS